MDRETATTNTTTRRPTYDHQARPTVPIPDEDSVDASIAAVRRVQHLSALVMERLDDTTRSTDEPEPLAKAVVKALYQIHPHIRLDDALELAHIIEVPPEDVSTRRAIEHVVDDACTHLDAWRCKGTDDTGDACRHPTELERDAMSHDAAVLEQLPPEKLLDTSNYRVITPAIGMMDEVETVNQYLEYERANQNRARIIRRLTERRDAIHEERDVSPPQPQSETGVGYTPLGERSGVPQRRSSSDVPSASNELLALVHEHEPKGIEGLPTLGRIES